MAGFEKLLFQGSFLLLIIFAAFTAKAIDVPATAKALRLSNTITGGLMPTTDPVFALMVQRVQAGDIKGAALLATQTKYYADYLAKRLAFQMQSPSLDSGSVTHSDATAFIIAHFTGGGGIKPSISTLWSENATYTVNVTANGTTTQVRAAALTPAQQANVNWLTDLVRTPGQNAKTAGGAAIAIPEKHVGGYATLSDRGNDNSFAMYGAMAGTNLRMIEGIWRISTGLTLVDVQSSSARPQDVPRFIPEYDENFFVGQGQSSCISCHGGGFSSLNHGYSAVADIFDYTAERGLIYIAAPTTQTRKSLGSDPNKRNSTLTCNLSLTPTPVCNPDSLGTDPNQAWDLNATWSNTGTLIKMGWTGDVRGEGLNALGVNIGKAKIVYSYLTKRVIAEICPMGIISENEITAIADEANPFSEKKGTDDIRTIISLVAAHSTCI